METTIMCPKFPLDLWHSVKGVSNLFDEHLPCCPVGRRYGELPCTDIVEAHLPIDLLGQPAVGEGWGEAVSV